MNKEKYLNQLKSHALERAASSHPVEEMTDHQKRIFSAIQGSPFGCKSPLVSKFASAFAERQFDLNERSYINGEIVVPIKNGSNHNYPLDIPVCVIVSNTGFRIGVNDHGSGDLPSMFGDRLRPATPYEIEKFFEEISKNGSVMNNFLNYMKNHSDINPAE